MTTQTLVPEVPFHRHLCNKRNVVVVWLKRAAAGSEYARGEFTSDDLMTH
jgi:hypothetical protein